MFKSKVMMITSLMIVFAMVLSACQAAATPTVAPTQAPQTQPTAVPQASPTAGFQIPEIQQGKFNVAVVLVGFHADGGWSQAHTEGAQWLSTQDPSIAVQYVELINPGPDANQLCARSPAKASI